MIGKGMFVLILVCSVLWFLVLRALMVGGKAGGARGRSLGSGLEARGIVLSADRMATSSTTIGGMRFETRNLRLDVEIPGQQPYEIMTAPLIPRICEVFPGSTLDLLVSPTNPNDIKVIGPAGSSGWMAAMPTLFPAVPGLSRAGRGGRNVGCLVTLLVILGIVDALLVLGFIGEMVGKDETSTSTHAKVTTGSEGSSACQLAARCCSKIGGSNCSFKNVPDEACDMLLMQQKKAAAKLHKTCE
jgi:hypothetical protein